MAEPFEAALHAELVVRTGISKVETRRDGEISLEDKSKLSNDSLSAWACVCDQETRFRGIEHPLSGVDELADLESCGPHGALTTSNSSVSVAIIEHFVWHESTP